MSLTWGEYWLLETAVHGWIPLRFLMDPELTQRLNKPGHHLSEPELVAMLLRLLERGEILCGRGEDPPHRPSSQELTAGLRCTEYTPASPGLSYGLSAAGGRRWESAARPDWSRAISYSSGPAKDELTGARAGRGEIVAADRTRAELCLAGTRAPVRFETLAWDRLEPWDVSYWKRLPVGHRVRFRSGPEEPSSCGGGRRRSWYLEHSSYYQDPEFLLGSLYALPLADGRRGIARVIERVTSEDTAAAPCLFVVACDWVGPRMRVPGNLAQVARRFMRLSSGARRNAIFGAWVRGAIPAAWRLLGSVEVSPEERQMARSCSSASTCEGVGALILEEWQWRHDSSGRGCLQQQHAPEGSAANPAPSAEAGWGPREREALGAQLAALRARAPRAGLEAWSRGLRLERWTDRLEACLRQILACNPGAAGRLDRYALRIERPTPDGLSFELVLGFRAGETYCCAEPACHLPLSEGRVWERLRELLVEQGMNRRPPPMTVREVAGIVEAGARFEVAPQPEALLGQARARGFHRAGQRELEALRSSPRRGSDAWS